MPSGSLGAAFGNLITDLGNSGWLTPQQQQTACSLYHITDVKHAASILVSGALLSRRKAQAARVLVQETGNPGILGGQGSWIADHARLYFRPAAPSLFHSEGIRPRGMYGSGECPVPVCLAFDAQAVLDLPRVRFSNGNTIEHARLQVGSSPNDLQILDLPDVLSEGAMPDDATAKDLVTFRRHAEVMVPERVPADLLDYVAVRTIAERQTLLSLVQSTHPDPAMLQKLNRLVRVNRSLFCNFWARVERSWMEDGRLVFVIVRGGCRPQPSNYRPAFDLHLRVETESGTLVDRGRISMDRWSLQLEWSVASLMPAVVMSVSLYMDGQLAYEGTPDLGFPDEQAD